MSALSKKVKAHDPHLRDPEVGPGEAWCQTYLDCSKFLQGSNKCAGMPSPGHLPPTTRMQALAKIFRVNLPGSAENGPFSATGRILSPGPDFSALPNQHHLIELLSADQVQAIWQVLSARAQRVLASKGPMERLSRLGQSFIKLFNH